MFLIIIISSIISISIFFIIMNSWVELRTITPEENDFYKKSFKNKTIFIIGSSEVQSINATRVTTILHQSNQDYDVYNLGIGADYPKIRIQSIESIIDSDPSLVIYGVGYRDFWQFSNKEDFFSDTIQKENELLPNIKQFIEKEILVKIGFYSMDFEFIKNPRDTTFHNFRKVINNNENFQKEDNDVSVESTPFYHNTISTYQESLKNYANEQSLSCNGIDIPEERNENQNRYALEKMTKKLKDNKIKVILFTTPIHQNCTEKFSSNDIMTYKIMLEEIANKNEIPIYFLDDIYNDLDIWHNFHHIIFQNSIQFEKDIADIIKNEITP